MMIKKTFPLLFIFLATLFSCSQKKNEVEFSHAVHLDSTLKTYEFIIRNVSDRNLLIIVQGLYLKTEGRGDNQYIMDASSETFGDRYFEVLNTEEFDQTILASVLLAKTYPTYREDFRLFTNPNRDFPGLLFIKSHSIIVCRYKLNKNFPKGKYTIHNGWNYISNSKKMKEWKKELERINKIEDYFYTDLIAPTDKGIPFEIK
jgi:hypothetical protein